MGSLAAAGETSVTETTGASPTPTPIQAPEVSAPKSYANAVSNRSVLSKFDVSVSLVDGKPTVAAVPDEVIEDSTPLWKDFLIGRFPTDAPHVAKIHVIVNKIWNLGDKNIKIDVFVVNANTIKFRIRHESARLRVLRRGMWNICNLPMTVSKWSPIAEEAQPEITSMPMWIVIKNVPHSMFTWPGLSFLASPVGYPKKLHQETELVTKFEEAKIFVEVDLTQDLLHHFHFTVKGEELSVSYEYPWLPPRCVGCQKWGHSEEVCLTSLGRAKPSLTKAVSVAASPLRNPSSPIRSASVTEPGAGINTAPHAILQKTMSSDTNAKPSAALTVPEIVAEPIVETVIDTNAETEIDVVENREIGISEPEEGEIPVGDGEGEWLNVNSSGGKNLNQGRELVYGSVRIASPTRYDILRDNDEESDELLSSMAVKDLQADLDKSKNTGTNKGRAPLRVPPPRNSKNSSKFQQGSSNKATDSGPSYVYQRNHSKKH